MLAGLVTGKRKVELVEFPDPVAEPGKAVVEIAYCGICGTDLHAWLSGEPYNPAICGHEWCGHISAVGAGVGHLKEGDRVAIGVASACGRCPTCLRGDAAHCEAAFAGAIGAGPLAAPHGGFASAIAFDAARLYHVPDTLSDAECAILEPATVAVHAVRRTDIRLGDSVVVIGAGPIGLLVMQAARAAGAGRLVILEPAPERRQLAGMLGADVLIDPATGETAAAVDAAVGAAGADVVFECAGIAQTVQHAVDFVRRGGIVSLVGVPATRSEIDAAGWLVKEVRLTSSIAYQHEDFDIAKSLVADRRIDVAALHTGTAPLAEIGTAFESLAENPSDVKVLIAP